MRVLVVGGAGYIGSHVCRTLQRRGHTTMIVDNLSTGHRFLANGHPLVVADMSDKEKVMPLLANVDGVMHFAAHAYVGESVENPRKYLKNNVEAGISFLNSVLDAGVRKIVFSSSCTVYGIPSKVPISEDMPRQPISPYGATKLFFEHALEAYSCAYSLKFVSLRYFNAAGADESGEIGECHLPEPHLIPSALQAVMGLRRFTLYGDDYETPDGTCIRDYIHVNDLAEAHVRAIEYLAEGRPSVALNLGTGTGYSVKQVLRTVHEVTGRPVPVEISSRRSGDPPILIADPWRARELLGWAAQRSLTDIVSTAWRWNQREQKEEAEILDVNVNRLGTIQR